jgi:hypothetical protein
VSMTLPSRNWVFRKGSVVINPGFAFRPDGAIEIRCGNPNRAVPRVTMLELSTRSSTGTRIGDGVGGAVRAATSAGDWINLAARKPPATAAATSARTQTKTIFLCLFTADTPRFAKTPPSTSDLDQRGWLGFQPSDVAPFTAPQDRTEKGGAGKRLTPQQNPVLCESPACFSARDSASAVYATQPLIRTGERTSPARSCRAPDR